MSNKIQLSLKICQQNCDNIYKYCTLRPTIDIAEGVHILPYSAVNLKEHTRASNIH